ncbi:MAG: radical SAM protein [bacterium]|nr:radical SAM protein [bacterium]
MSNILENCNLCPRRCGVNRAAGQKGFCGALSLLRTARIALHFWEEPCISGESGSGTVFFSHCTMKCVFCQNYEISTCSKGSDITIEELAEGFLSLQEQGANNINLVTPTHFVPQIIEALNIAKNKGLALPVLYNTGGYENVETLKMLEGYIDIYMPDFKYYNDKYAIKYSNAPDYFKTASEALREMVRQTGRAVINDKGIMTGGTLVRHLMLPGLMLDSKRVMDYLYDNYGDDIYISLMCQYTPLPHVRSCPELDRRVDMDKYNALVDYCARRGMEKVFIQSEESAAESFIPSFNGRF